MRFYTKQHLYYCGIDLHARTMYVCVLNQEGEIVLHRNMPCSPESFIKVIAPYRQDLAVAVECIFTWYWLADLCSKENIPFVLGHALYMKAIHGGKAKTDKIDAYKIAVLRFGKLYGVDAIASGSVTELASAVEVNARLIDTETGRVFAVANTQFRRTSSPGTSLDDYGGSRRPNHEKGPRRIFAADRRCQALREA